MQGFVSSNNSTATALAADQVFQGAADDLKDCSSVAVTAYSDQASAAGGLSIQFSTDQVNWDIVAEVSLPPASGYWAAFPCKARYFQIVYTNGSADQSVFRLQTILRDSPATDQQENVTSSTTVNAFGQTGDVIVEDGRSQQLVTIPSLRGLDKFVYKLQNLLLTQKSWILSRYWAVRHGVDPPKSVDGQSLNGICNVHGIPFFIGGHPNIQSLRANYTAAQTNTVFLSNAAGTKIVVTRVMATLDKGASVNVSLVVGLAATITPTTMGVVAAHPGIDPGGGFVAGTGAGILEVGNDGDQLLVTCAVPTGGSLDLTVSYYLVPV